MRSSPGKPLLFNGPNFRGTYSKPFTADEDWLDKLTFRIRNTPDKTIGAFWLNVAFPGTDLGRGGYAGVGILYDAKKSSDQNKRILPGGEVDVTPSKISKLITLTSGIGSVSCNYLS